MASTAAEQNTPVHPLPETQGETIGITYGDVGSTRFHCTVLHPIERNEYVTVNHEVYGPVLGQVEDVERKTDLSLDRAIHLGDGQPVQVDEKEFAVINVLGYRDGRNLLQVPRTPFRAGEPVHRADPAFIRQVLGLREDRDHGAYLGLLAGHGMPIYLDINTMVQKHVAVLAKTGGGKSYAAGVLLEEFMKHGVTVLILDPHGEYSTLAEPAERGDDFTRFSVRPRGYGDSILEFSPDAKVNPRAHPLKFTLANLTAREILELTNQRKNRAAFTALKRAVDLLQGTGRDYDLGDLLRVLESGEESTQGALLGDLEYLQEAGIFGRQGTRMDELVVEGRTTVVNFKGVPPDVQELVVDRIANALFELRRVGKLPPMMLVVEEAHNFCPQMGQAACSRILRTIASEGRKFGLGLLVITQRAAKIDKNVLSQCNLQIVLKVTNPNDLKAIAASVEGMTRGMEDEIQRLPVGVALVMGANLSTPLFVEVRPRETRHGGEAVKILPD